MGQTSCSDEVAVTETELVRGMWQHLAGSDGQITAFVLRDLMTAAYTGLLSVHYSVQH